MMASPKENAPDTNATKMGEDELFQELSMNMKPEESQVQLPEGLSDLICAPINQTKSTANIENQSPEQSPFVPREPKRPFIRKSLSLLSPLEV